MSHKIVLITSCGGRVIVNQSELDKLAKRAVVELSHIDMIGGVTYDWYRVMREKN